MGPSRVALDLSMVVPLYNEQENVRTFLGSVVWIGITALEPILSRYGTRHTFHDHGPQAPKNESAEAEPGPSGAICGGRAPNDENNATHGEVSTGSSPGRWAQLDVP